MSDATEASTAKKERSPSFPYIGLTKAQERLREFYSAAKRFEVRMADAAGSWGMGVKSSATLQTVSALLAYGLIEDQGSGENRKVKISDRGFRILEDQRPGIKERELAAAACTPKLIAEYVELWKDGRPTDAICISELKIDRSFTEDGAKAFLRVFDDVVGFTKGDSSDKKGDKAPLSGGTGDPEPPLDPPPPTVKVGDYVQWVSGGVDQLKPPRKVVAIMPDRAHAQVFGYNGALPMSDLHVVPPPAPAALPAFTPPASADEASAWVQGENDFNVFQRGNRLQITADVDLAGLAELKEMLGHYEAILKLREGRKKFSP